MRSHMARYARCGWSVPRSFGSLVRSALSPLGARKKTLALALVLSLFGLAKAQDVNVAIEPKTAPTPDATKVAPLEDPAAKMPGVVSDPGLKMNHGKPLKVDVDLVLVNVTVTDDWNRIVTG